MAEIWKEILPIENIASLFLFFLPGFISVKVYDTLVPHERRDFSKSIFELVGFSALNFAFFSWLIWLMHSDPAFTSHGLLFWVCFVLIVVVAPIFWPILFLMLLSWPPVARITRHPFPQPWDYVFGKGHFHWIIVHLKDRRRIGGWFGPDSFASSYPEREQIYLEKVWRLDSQGKFAEPINLSTGVIVQGEEITAVEFFK